MIRPFSFLKLVFSVDNFSSDVSLRMVSSRSKRPVNASVPSSQYSATGTGTVSASKKPASAASAARRWLSRANASSSSRLISHFSATRSAASPWDVSSYRSDASRPNASPCRSRLLPIGTRLIFSAPPATTISAAPDAIAPIAACTAASPDPHFLSIVNPGTAGGQPAPRREVRAIFADCSPI